MYYSKISKCDMINGDGLRVSLFVSGCSFACPGCFNKVAWNPRYGEPFTEQTFQTLVEYINQPEISGLTLLGGDPMHHANYADVIELCERLKKLLPEKTIWMYTGYTYEELLADLDRKPILDIIDVLVDGRYIQEQKVTGKFYGSRNQRIIRL